jgi:serine/threonine-protein kinase
MGEVWLAKDTRLGRYVALKLLPERVAADGELTRRLTHEARAASALNHPNILTVHDIGEHQGRPYVVSEYVEGISLRERLGHGPLPFAEAAGITLQIAEGLSAAHRIGLVHRDIKPENIMLRTDGRVKVLDFGIAKRLTEDPAQTGLTATRSGAVLGTVAYLSPEQARCEPVDTRTDLWALGAVLYEMTTGRQAFTGTTAASIFDAILNRVPVPALQLNPQLPPGLEHIIGKALEKDRERRYQGAADIQSDLNRLIRDGGLALGTGSDAVTNSNERPRREKRIAAAAACIVVLASISSGIFYLRNRDMHPQMKAITSVAVLPFTNTNRDTGSDYLGDGISASIINSLSSAPQLKVIARTTTFRFKGKEIDPQQLGRLLHVGAVVTGTLAQHGDAVTIQTELIDAGSGAELWGEQYQRPMSQIQDLQGEIAGDIAGKLRLRLAGQQQQLISKRYTNNGEAYQLYLQALYSSRDWKKSLEYLNQAIAKDPDFALAHVGVATLYSVLGTLRVLPANEAFAKQKASALKALSIDGMLSEAHLQFAEAMFKLDWDWAGAERAFHRAPELNSNVAHLPYAIFLMQVGRLQDGMLEARKAEELDPLSPNTLGGLAMAYYLAREYDESLKKLQAADPQGRPSFIRGFVLSGERRYNEAIAEFQHLGPNAAARGHLAHAYAMAGKTAEAKAILRELEASAEKRQVGAYEAGFTYGALGDKDRAFAWLDKAYQQRDPGLTYIKVDPCLDPLRPDPRFTALEHRVGLL